MELPSSRMKKGFSPVTILFIAAAIAIVLIAFASFQIQASYLTPKAKIHSSDLERQTRDAKLLAPSLAERSAALASFSLAQKGGASQDFRWYCNGNYSPSLPQLEASFCDEGALIFSSYNFSSPFCLKPFVSNASFLEGEFLIEPLGAELNLSTADGTSYETSSQLMRIGGNRYWLLASKMSDWFSQNDVGSRFDALLSKPCQARRCSCGAYAGLGNSTLALLEVSESDALPLLGQIQDELNESFNNSAISCSYELLSARAANNITTSSEVAEGCSCANTEFSDSATWASMNSEAEPSCQKMLPSDGARCRPFRTAAILGSPTPFLKSVGRGLGTLMQECSLPTSTCAFSQSIIIAPGQQLSDAEYSALLTALENGSVVIASVNTYIRLRHDLEATELPPKSLIEQSEISANYFAFGNSGVILLPEPVPENITLAELYSSLYLEIIDELTASPPPLQPCPTSGSLILDGGIPTQLPLANSTHSLASVSRELEVSAKITCTDSQSIIATEQGLQPLSFSALIEYSKRRECPLPEACASATDCQAPS